MISSGVFLERRDLLDRGEPGAGKDTTNTVVHESDGPSMTEQEHQHTYSRMLQSGEKPVYFDNNGRPLPGSTSVPRPD